MGPAVVIEAATDVFWLIHAQMMTYIYNDRYTSATAIPQ